MKILSKNKIYDSLKQNEKLRKKIKHRSILFALFVLSINAYAWFIYISKVRIGVDASVASWDVNFMENNNVISERIYAVDIYPGMDAWRQEIDVTNNSDVKAKFNLELMTATLFGESIFYPNTTQEEMFRILREDTPFIVDIKTNKPIMDKHDSAKFITGVFWEYENFSYYPVLSPYKYDPSATYYEKVAGAYRPVEILHESDFLLKKNTLYMEKDEVDTYIGEECARYKKANGNKACLFYKVELSANQDNS